MISYSEKYFPDNRDKFGNRLHWPGLDNEIPVRSPVTPNLTQDEYDRIQVTKDANTKIFELWDSEQLEEYNTVVDKCAKGLAQIRHEIFLADEDKKSWRVLCQWFDLIGELPKTYGSSYESLPVPQSFYSQQ